MGGRFRTSSIHRADRRAANRSAHLAYWGRLNEQKRLIFAGPLLNGAGEKMIGSLLIFEADDLACARELMKNDPYVTGEVFEHAHLHPLRQGMP